MEAELRHQTAKLQDLEKSVAQKDGEIAALKATVSGQAGQPLATAGANEAGYRRASLSKIEFGMTTGGKDADGDGRDDGVALSIVCRDYDGDAFKCPGAIAVGLFEALPNGMKRQLGAWVFDSDAVRSAWRSTLLGAGYAFEIPWPLPPTESKLIVTAAFQTADGRRFEAEKAFTAALAVKGPAKQPGKTLQMSPTPLPPGAMLKMPVDEPPHRPESAEPKIPQAKKPVPVLAPPTAERRLAALDKALDESLPSRVSTPLLAAPPPPAKPVADDDFIDLDPAAAAAPPPAMPAKPSARPLPAKPSEPPPALPTPKPAAVADDEYIDLGPAPATKPAAATAPVAPPPGIPEAGAPKKLSPQLWESVAPLPSAALERSRRGSVAFRPWDYAPIPRDAFVRPAADR